MRLPPKILALSAAGLLALAGFEGFRQEAYEDTGGVATIGFGSTRDVQMGDRISVTEGLARLLGDVREAEAAVDRCVKVPVSQNEYDAFVSFAFNVGGGAFCGSTLVRKLNIEDYPGACRELMRWVYDNGRKLPGLVKRRAEEYRMCAG